MCMAIVDLECLVWINRVVINRVKVLIKYSVLYNKCIVKYIANQNIKSIIEITHTNIRDIQNKKYYLAVQKCGIPHTFHQNSKEHDLILLNFVDL